MSFILDALKKAETERNRQSGPVLMDVRIAPPRRRLPTWAWVLGAVLVANLALLAFLMTRAPRRDASPAAVATTTPADTPATAAPAPSPAAPVTPAPAAPAATLPAPMLPPPTLPAAAVNTLPAPVTPAPAALPDAESLPTAQDLLAAGVPLPPLQLNLHVYDAQPANRYVLLNGVRLREGEYTPDGIKVQAITPRGAVLEASGRRFLLVRLGG